VAYRIDSTVENDHLTFAFQGVLDRLALADLAERVARAEQNHSAVRVRLLAGTEVDAGALEELVRRPGISVTADASFLSRWIASCGLGSRGTPKQGERERS
jgi:hypothetical protein